MSRSNGAKAVAQPVRRTTGHSPAREIVELLVPEQDLDHADIDLLLEQVGGEAVAQRVHRHALVDPGRLGSGMHRPVELTGAERFDRIESGKQPAAIEHLALGTRHSPPGAQALEQHRREHGVTVLAPLALLDAQDHALTVDVADLERHHLARAQSGAVGYRERGLVLQVAGRANQAGDFLTAQHHRQRLRHAHRPHLVQQFAVIERDLEEELQPGNGGVQ